MAAKKFVDYAGLAKALSAVFDKMGTDANELEGLISALSFVESIEYFSETGDGKIAGDLVYKMKGSAAKKVNIIGETLLQDIEIKYDVPGLEDEPVLVAKTADGGTVKVSLKDLVDTYYPDDPSDTIEISINSHKISADVLAGSIAKSHLATALKNELEGKQNKIPGLGSTNLLVAPGSAGGDPTGKPIADFIAAPAAQTANTQLLVAPATQGDAPTLKAISSLADQEDLETLEGRVDTLEAEVVTLAGGGITTVTSTSGIITVTTPGGSPNTRDLDLSAAVYTSLGKADSAYQAPGGVLPKADMASGVQASLDLADTAVQPAELAIPIPLTGEDSIESLLIACGFLEEEEEE